MKKIAFFSLFYLLFLLSLSTYAQNIVSTNPSLNANQVAVDANLSITFDTVITPSLFNEISITVSGAQTGTIAGTFSGVNTNTITFNPDQNFKNGELISISASSSFGGLVGSFTTATNQVSQVIFSGAANVIATGSNGSINVYPADLDGDGHVDVLSATLNTNTIAWQKNDGNGNFLAQQIITTSVNQARDVFAADLDGDGDLDVISASSGDDRLAWYENNGLGNFGPQQNITIVENETRRVYAADMDGDGDMDVYSTSINTNSIAWYENNNNGTTWIRRSISNSDGTGRDMQAADFDNDGDLDMLVLGNSSNERYLFKNDGNGNFGSRQVIPSSPSNIPWDLHITDLNNDGNLDMLIAFFSTNVISWQENDGTGNFGAPQTITPQLNNVRNVSSADVDGDGDMDVLSSSIGDDRIAWYPNDGLGGFGAQQTITTTADFVSDLYVVDLDNDGNMDVLSALASTNKIVWYENLAARRLISTIPDNNSINVATSANIVLTFDSPVTSSDVNTNNIVITGNQTAPIAGTFSGQDTNTITFNPNSDFKPGEIISVSVTSSIVANPTVLRFTASVSPDSPGEFANGEKVISTTADAATDVISADIDGDGDIDVLSASSSDDTIAWYANDGLGNFGIAQNISTSANGAQSVTTADIDGDGDIDVLSASFFDDTIAWYANDGLGNFGIAQNITTSADSARSVTTADIDGDGDLDVLSASSSDDTIAWYANDGLGNFGIAQNISTSADGARSVTTADIDGDGDLDVLSASSSDDTIAWYANDGLGNFGAAQNISTSANGALSVTTADIDGDGDLDVLSASSSDDTIAWYANDGLGNFGTPQNISTSANAAQSVTTADIDGDGDLDVLSASSSDDTIAWYANDGLGNFGIAQNISTTAAGAQSVTAGDIDGDGDLDVLSASIIDDKIAWYENVAATQLLISSPANNAINVANNANIVLTFNNPVPFSDVNTNNIVITGNQTAPIAGTFSGQDTSTITFNPNSDFKPDEIINVSVTSSIVANPTVLRFTASVSPDSPGEFANGENVISTTADAATDVISADIDGDGDLDVLSASSNNNTIAWYANDSLGNFGIAQNISTIAVNAESVTTADVDGDGDLDVLSASFTDDKIALYVNDGLGNFGIAQNISTSANGAQSVTTADIDRDGDLDVLSASFNGDTIAWYANDGLGNFGTAQNISTSADGATDVIAADIDGDGDLDVLSASFNDDTIAWYANDGSGNFGIAQNISTSADGARSVTTADIDGDGDLDVLSASALDDTIAWYVNDGLGNFVIAQNISTSADGARSVTTADIDGDGDLDVLSASSNVDTIAWYANDGLGNFGIAQNISTTAAGAQSVTAGDIDGDGDLDVLSASIIDDKIAWYENVSPPDCLDATTYTIAGGWDNGDPTETKTAIIAESYSTSLGNITACSLVILDGAILTVEADTFVQIENDISVDGYLLVAHTGSVVQIDDDAVVTGAGSFSVLVDTPDLDVRDFMIMGSPMDAETRENVWASAWNVQNYTPANFNPVVAVTDAYNFADAELDDWNLYTTGPLAAGEGFLVRPQTSLNGAGGVFAYDYNTGFLTNGVVTRPLNYNTTQLDSPNMLSNPYPSAIDADVFLDPIINPDIDAVYFWEHILAPDPSFPGSSTTGPNYSMGDVSFYNAMGGIGSASGSATPSNVISTAQGFGIFSNNPAGGTATFNNSMRLTTGNNTLRAPEVNRNRLWLHITSEAYGVGGTTLVGFTENATAGFDRRYDSQRVATHVSLFSHIDTNDTGYAIQGREVFNTEMTIALGFSSIIEEETSYTISLSDFDGIAWETNSPYLEDTITGIVTNLNESSYRFTSDSGVFNNRFILKFKDREVLDIVENTLSQITILPNPTTGLVIVNSPIAMITTISVLDVRGRVILRSNNVADFNRQIDLSNLSSAVYFINVSTENGTVLKKIIKN